MIRSNPSEIIIALQENCNSPQKVELIATPPPGVDLYKLARLGDVMNEINAGTLSLAEGDATPGMQQSFQMFVVAATIFAGILIGTTKVRPEKTL